MLIHEVVKVHKWFPKESHLTEVKQGLMNKNGGFAGGVFFHINFGPVSVARIDHVI